MGGISNGSAKLQKSYFKKKIGLAGSKRKDWKKTERLSKY